jgi:GNAT superfamily N-acetyltransferase
MPVSADLDVRRATPADLPAVLTLLQRALGWSDDDTRFLEWKHLQNPFGASPMWVALDRDRVVGFRAFLRWELVTPAGRVRRAARAVDTATDPDFQGRGVFTRLTSDALDALRDEGVDLVFNTPNANSLPGYRRLGWRELGRLPTLIRPTRPGFLRVVGTARRAASREPVATDSGIDAGSVLADRAAVGRLLASGAPAAGLTTRRTPEYLAWRYGWDDLGYRVILHGQGVEAGMLVYRHRRRGRAVEGVVAEVLVPGGDRAVARSLVARLARGRDVDYLVRIAEPRVTRDGFVRLPQVGPVLVCRSLAGARVPDLPGWALGMGDVELL